MSGRLRERLRQRRAAEEGKEPAREPEGVLATIAVHARMESRRNVGRGVGYWRVRVYEGGTCVAERRGAVRREESSGQALPYEATLAGAEALVALLAARAIAPERVRVAVHSPNRTFVAQLAGQERVRAPHLRALWQRTQDGLRPFGDRAFFWRRLDGSVRIAERPPRKKA
ncbi:MAG: hypothetical protein NZ761_09080 [Dehalococcoidia bacterium]|nr:hypothetical protein [Dehalococcoidia bacterium]